MQNPMPSRILFGAFAALALLGAPAHARLSRGSGDDSTVSGGGSTRLPPYLQCVPYARMATGIAIHGDARTWWSQAEGHYARGFVPRVGAVMALKPHGNSTLGHVAAVSRIIDSRTILISHSNWSPINGRRGQIERNVEAVDVSPGNNWSEVRVWYAPIHALGGSHWPVQGFIYKTRPHRGEPALRQPAAPRPARSAAAHRLAPATGHDPIGALIAARLGL